MLKSVVFYYNNQDRLASYAQLNEKDLNLQ